MPKLILVKHSLPDIKPEQPAHKWGLSSEGRQRCIQLANRLAGYYPGRIITSPEPKALDTARYLAHKIGVPLQVNDRLYEHRRSKAPYLPYDQFCQSIQSMFQRPEERVYGDESASEALHRFSSAIYRLLEQYPSQNLVVVAHGTVISLFTAAVCRTEPYELWKRLGLPSFVVLRTPEMTLEDIVENVGKSAAREFA